MPAADDVFARERAASRRRLWQVPLGFAALMVAFILVSYLLAAMLTGARALSGTPGGIAAMAVFVLHLAFVVVMFFALPQGFLVHRLDVTNLWARLGVGAVSGWMYLFASAIDAQLALPGATFVGLVTGLPRFAAGFAAHESRFDLVLFAAIGAAFGGLLWGPMYRLGNKRDWDDPILGGRPPYAR